MKKLFVAFFAIATLASCSKDNIVGSGNTSIEARPLSNFSKIDVEGNTNVSIVYGNNFEVKVEAYQNLLQHLKTTVSNGTLKIGYKSGTGISNDNSHVYITLPSLTKVMAKGLCIINVASGNEDVFEAELTGNPKLKAFDLTAREAKITMTGQGIAEITVGEDLDVTITGTSTVYYKGNPNTVSSDITGNGRVIKL
ncbi:MAG TPA: DUF2807 domain-containing protein [Ferruginibacter sp.]|nr:DUF2807 domain-containing protein [Ferruginibacter sp.]HRE63191.1 DUF2807 domain-containing protein [Ferruginibacter sp.]